MDTTAEFEIVNREFSFKPAKIEVKAGQPVKLTLKNTGVIEHDLTIQNIELVGEPQVESVPGTQMPHQKDPKPALQVIVGEQKTATLTFTPSKPGTYEFYCSVPAHKEAGMVGQLVVQ